MLNSVFFTQKIAVLILSTVPFISNSIYLHTLLYLGSISIIVFNHKMHTSHLSFYAALCPDPVDINNGMITFTGNSINDTATYSCNSGFELIGDATRTCTQVDVNFAIFSPQAPFCRRE